jgi:uncharacterized protein YkwD
MMVRRVSVSVALLALILLPAAVPANAASAFATPAFQAQWQRGEAVTPNFWGPLATAKEGQQEAYQQAPGGQRLVQYFDKGRMELTDGAVTNGLLATELVRGRVQTGDDTFQPKDPPAIPIAGDPDNHGPTYATLAGRASALLAPATSHIGASVTTNVSGAGDVTTGDALGDPAYTALSAFDDATKHNVAKPFANYRNTVGLATIGYAISEPFVTATKLAGFDTRVLVQVFERRTLTFADPGSRFNPAGLVEMGNVGQHYYQWRYPNGAPPQAAVQPAPPASTGNGLDSEEADFLARINAYRQANGAAPLSASATLTQAAKWMSADMAAKRYFDHTDSQGRDPFQRMCAFGYCAQTSKAENIAAGEATAARTFDQWKNSSGHNRNMLDPAYTVIGIGRAQGTPGDPYGWYWTTDFGGTSG